MKVHIDCFPCFLRQAVIALTHGTEDEALKERILKGLLPLIYQADVSKPPAYTTTILHRRIRQALGTDPFKQIKSRYNRIALGLYPSLKEVISKSSDPLWTAARLAIAGNIIDFGIFTSVDIEGAISKALNSPIDVDDYDEFKDAIEDVDEIFYLIDNAGEIVFDRLLIETLKTMGKRVTAVVKGSPVINDSTISDAKEVDLDRVCPVIDNSSDAVGTILEWTSPSFRKGFNNSPMVISKGQGNFETLYNARKKDIYFLFQAKCDVVSTELSLPQGAMLLMKGKD